MKPLSFLLLPGLCAAVYAASPSPGTPLAVVPAVLLQEDAAAVAPGIGDEIQGLIDEFESSYEAWVTKMRAADEDGRAALQEERPDPAAVVPKVMALVQKDPSSEGALTGLKFAMRATGDAEILANAYGIIEKHHVESEGMEDLIQMVRGSSDAAVSLFESAYEKNESNNVKAYAAHGLAKGLSGMLGDVNLSDAEKAAIEDRATKMFNAAIELGGEIETRRGTLADQVKNDLWFHENLRPGLEAPEIAAEDVGGTGFKLSDYRGKVVMLDFWGDW